MSEQLSLLNFHSQLHSTANSAKSWRVQLLQPFVGGVQSRI